MKKEEKSNYYKSSIKEDILRLAQFDPTCSDEYGNKVIDYLLLYTLQSYGRLPITADEIKICIKDNFKIEFEEAEIDAAGKRLCKQGKINYTEGERSERSIFQLLPETDQLLTKNVLKIKEMEKKVIEDWKDELCLKYKQYPEIKENSDRIIENLKIFIERMVVRHGVESVALLYPEKNKIRGWLNNIVKDIFEELPKIDNFADAIVKIEAANFFRSNDTYRIAYINSIFNSSFFWYLVQIDEKCSNLLKKITRGQKLYLDNNILFSLVGLHGAHMLQSVHNMLKLANVLGYELWVTNKTLDEFNSSLKWRMEELKQKPPLPSELARIALENLDEDSFVTVYWREFVEKRTKIEEFVTEKSHIESILKGLKIKTTNKFRKEIENSKELSDEMSILNSVSDIYISDHIIEHDAFHRILIKKIRKGPKLQFTTAGAWFLTHDSKLPEYDMKARRGKKYLPFCITTDQWIQVNRPLLVRTSNQKEYEESFHLLVTHPFLRRMLSSFSIEEAYHEVLGRLSRYERMNPQLALNIVADTHFMVSMASETDGIQKEKKIKSKFIDVANDLEKIKVELEKDIQKERKEIEKLKEKIIKETRISAETESEVQNLQSQLDKLNIDLKEKESDLNKYKGELEEWKEGIKFYKEEAESLKIEFSDYKRKVVKWIFYSVSLIFFSIFIWEHHKLFPWPWLENHEKKYILKVGAQILLIFLILKIPVRKHWVFWVSSILAIVLAILTIA